jgi:hypothetical protein
MGLVLVAAALGSMDAFQLADDKPASTSRVALNRKDLA